MNHINYSIVCGIISLLFLCNGSDAQTSSNKIIQGPFKTDLFPEGTIYFEKGKQDINSCQPTQFFLKYKNNNDLKQLKIDEYGSDPFCPELLSVFFYKLHNKQYIFTIIASHMDISAEHVDMDIYNIFAYTKNNNGVLVKDKKISNNPALTGCEGIQWNKNVTFKYKTAAEVKKYLKQKYH